MIFDYVVMPAIFFLIGALIVWLSVRRMISLSKKSCRLWRKIAERIVLSVVVLVAAAVALSSAYNAIAMQIFWAMHPAPGSFYQVHGHKMHLYCTGSGSPTIVLEAGWGVSSPVLGWGNFQPDLARITRVCSYDRAGLGWSEPQPGPGDADHVAANLHELLAQAGITGPIVLLSHSWGGIYARDYIAHYPANVVGLILLDSSTPDQLQRIAAVTGPQEPSRMDLIVRVFRLAYSAGIPRLMGMCKPIANWEPQAARLAGEDQCRSHFDALLNEYNSFNASSGETLHSGPFGALPILIVSHDPAAGTGPNEPPEVRKLEPLYAQMQEEQKQLSTHSFRIIAKGSTHEVHTDRKALVVSQVQLFIAQLRGTAPQPTNYGSTITD
jgi:pimeloyl-ACP methyl ester carboxylesterase